MATAHGLNYADGFTYRPMGVCGKIAYVNRAQAYRALERMRGRRQGLKARPKRGGPLEVYRCDHGCGAYHLGHKHGD